MDDATISKKHATTGHWSWLASFAAIWLTNVVFSCINHLPWYANAISGIILLIVTFVCYTLLQHHHVKPMDYVVFAAAVAVILVVVLVLAYIV